VSALCCRHRRSRHDSRPYKLDLVWKPITRWHGSVYCGSRTPTSRSARLQWQPSSRANGANSARATCQLLLSSPRRPPGPSLGRRLLSRYRRLLEVLQRPVATRNQEVTERRKPQEMVSRRVSCRRSRFLGQDQVLRMSPSDLLAHRSSSRRPAQVQSSFGALLSLQ